MKTTVLSLLFSLGALGWGLLNFRRVQELELRLDNARNSHFRFADQARKQIGTLENEIRALQRQLRALTSGGQLFQPDMTIEEATTVDPRAAEVLQAFHIGGCSSCAVSPQDTLQQAAEANGQDPALLLQALNKLATSEASEVRELLDRRPNVQISL